MARDLELSSRRAPRPGLTGGRGPVVSRAAPVGQAPLLLCAAGPHHLVVDLRTLRHIDADAPLPMLPGMDVDPTVGNDELDLRELLGAEASAAPQALLFSTPDDPTLRRMIVDAGSLRLRRVDLARVHPVPAILRGFAPLAAVRAVVELDDGGVAWLIDPAHLHERRGGGA